MRGSLRDNFAHDLGGAAYLGADAAVSCDVLNAVFGHNDALLAGGAIFQERSHSAIQVSIRNSLFHDNFAADRANAEVPDFEVGGGGAIVAAWPESFEITNCTLVDNATTASAPCAGGGGILYVGIPDYTVSHDTSLSVRNSIVWNNRDMICNEPLVSFLCNEGPGWCYCDFQTCSDFDVEPDYNDSIRSILYMDGLYSVDEPAVNFSDIEFYGGLNGPGITDNDSDGDDEATGNRDVDPLLTAAFRIPPDSPVVDKGDDGYLDWALDIDRQNRTVGVEVDMGVNEVQPGACCTPNDYCEVTSAGACPKIYLCDVNALRTDSSAWGDCGDDTSPNVGCCLGDADGNGTVNAGDRGSVGANIGQLDPELVCLFDMDGNGVINAADRGVVSANLGVCAALPNFMNGSGLNAAGNGPDARFAGTFQGEGTECSGNMCPAPESLAGPSQEGPVFSLEAGSNGSYSVMVDANANCLDGAIIFGLSAADETVLAEACGELDIIDLGTMTSAVTPSTVHGSSMPRRDMVVVETVLDPEETGGELCSVIPAEGVTLILEIVAWRHIEDDSVDTWFAALAAG